MRQATGAGREALRPAGDKPAGRSSPPVAGPRSELLVSKRRESAGRPLPAERAESSAGEPATTRSAAAATFERARAEDRAVADDRAVAHDGTGADRAFVDGAASVDRPSRWRRWASAA